MIVAAKCNITKYALEQVRELVYGFRCKKDTNQEAVIENYINHLDCESVNIETCLAEPCSNEATILDCEDSSITKITQLFPDEIPLTIRDRFYTVLAEDVVNLVAPFTYQWEFDESIFELASGALTDSTIHLKILDDLDPELIIGAVTVTITDALGCSASKTCYETINGTECDIDYEPCPNAKELTVENISE